MKKIAVLVDFTESSHSSLVQANVIARLSGAEVAAVHMTKDGSSEEMTVNKVTEFISRHIGSSFETHPVVGQGNLFDDMQEVLTTIQPDLVIACTHGIHGVAQHLFGAHIFKLVQSIAFPCLVVQENTWVRTEGMKKILFPVSPNPHIMVKIRQTAALAKVFNAEIVQYEIDKYLGDSEDDIRRHVNMAADYFTKEGIRHSHVLEENKIISLGYSRQIMAYADAHQFDCISLMTELIDPSFTMEKADKEQLLTNGAGIPVLMCNH